ncbi:MAG: hypothetical protein P1V97_30520, partial [Planctomycetota bacterium]|nr:hypothetical protein [Planctomycetota bacterium]
MRILFLCLSATALLCTPCMAQDAKNEAPVEQKYDISKLLSFDSSPVLSLEAFLLADSSDLPKELKVLNRLRTQRINCLFNETPLSDVIQFYKDITGLNFHCLIDQTAIINLRQRNAALGHALLTFLDQLDADASIH